MESTTRRRLLQAVAGGSAALVAGCNGGDGTTTTTEPTTTGAPTATETTDPATEATTRATTAGETTTDDRDLEALARELVARLDAGEYARVRELLAPFERRDLTTNRLANGWLGLVGQKGPYRGIAGTSRESTASGEVVTLALDLARENHDARVTFGDDGQVIGLRFPPDEYSPPAYADRSAFSERSVTVEDDDCTLAGTLTVPTGADPVPGVVLVHGSGPVDRDGTVGPNRPFQDLAWGLATRGVAVLRYEKENVACEMPLADWTLDDLVVDDAVTAAGVLGAAEGVRDDATFVAGHSLGGAATPRILGRAPDLGGGAMLAAPARPATRLVVEQTEHLLSLDGDLDETDQRRLDGIREAVERIEAGDVGDGEAVLGFPGAWWRTVLAYDQVATAREVTRPLALFQGGRDYQVDPGADFGRWREALPEATFLEYGSLNHLLQPGQGPSTSAEYQFHDSVAGELVEDLAAWVDRQV